MDIAADSTVNKATNSLTGLITVDKVLFIGLILLIALIVITQFMSRRRRNAIGEIELAKLEQTQIIVYAGFAIIFLLFISGVIIHAINGGDKFLINLSITIILSWIVLLICYYAWALYFYNINMGWSDDKWRRFRSQQEDPTVTPQSPNTNPHDEQTLGLPPGTVRGTMALTLLVGALALTIASLGMDNSTKSDRILIDNFDFYKKAFLMMIAFYFGTKSLEILQDKGNSKANTEADKGSSSTSEIPTGIVKEVNLESFQKDFTDPNALG